jgi:hypothetical protein
MDTWTIQTLISLLAVIVAFVALYRTSAVQKEQLEMQRVAAELAKKQLEMLARQDASSSTPVIRVDIVPHANAHHFLLTNIGAGRARNVRFTVEPHGRGSSPIMESDYRLKLPIPVLDPGASVGVLAAFEMGSATAFDVKLAWLDPSGEEKNDETFVTL